tara:strand:+ start:5241 stop:5768 length:528 start_codon:yes stop_codon:yes gene_type:complete
MDINIIVAYCKNNGIGLNNSMPWKISSDLKKFKKLTQGDGNNAIIMGKNTWLSLNCNPLTKRDNLILSTSLNIDIVHSNNIGKSFKNIEDLKDFLYSKKYTTVWIIGGENIYKQFIDSEIFKINNIYVTYIDEVFDCDTYFPKINLEKFHLKSISLHEQNNMNNEFNIYDIIYEN